VWEIGVEGSASIGPYAEITRYHVEPLSGGLSYTITPAEFVTKGGVIPSVATPAGIAELFGEGPPDVSAQATLDVNPTGTDNALTFTAVEYGPGGNDISIAYVDPGGTTASLAVTVERKAITVSLARAANAITTTAAQIVTAIEAHAGASELVTVEVDTSDSGSEDDGSGVVTAFARDYLQGGTGTGVGIARKGSRYTDYDTPALYINVGDADEPEWVALAVVEEEE
jgi:hypothetical protein